MPIRAVPGRTWIALTLLALFAGCGSGASSAAVHRTTIVIGGYAFAPASTKVAVGARVTWTNHDATAHTATAKDQSFDTGSLSPGASRTLTLSKPGTYVYHCDFHAFMRAQITVAN